MSLRRSDIILSGKVSYRPLLIWHRLMCDVCVLGHQFSIATMIPNAQVERLIS